MADKDLLVFSFFILPSDLCVSVNAFKQTDLLSLSPCFKTTNGRVRQNTNDKVFGEFGLQKNSIFLKSMISSLLTRFVSPWDTLSTNTNKKQKQNPCTQSICRLDIVRKNRIAIKMVSKRAPNSARVLSLCWPSQICLV